MIHLLLSLACSSAPPPTAPPATPVLAPAITFAEPTEPRYAASHILISFAGATRATSSRTEAEAKALAEGIRAQALAGEDFGELAREHGDGPSSARGGALGVYPTGTMVPDFERAVASVGVGQIGPLVRTPFGWHVVRRDAVVEADAAHILVSWSGAWRSKAGRSRDEALAKMQLAVAALDAGRPFDEVAREFSEGPSAPNGGDLGRVAPGQFLPPFEDALFALSPGQRSDVVETAYGFHVILRR